MRDHKCGLAFAKEAPRLPGEFGEVDDEKVAGEAEDAGDESFDLLCLLVMCRKRIGNGTYDEDPAPSREISKAVHLHDSVREDTGKSRRHATDEVEDCVALLQLEACVPAGKQVCAAGEETGFEDTEDYTEAEHLVPFLDKAKALEVVRNWYLRWLK